MLSKRMFFDNSIFTEIDSEKVNTIEPYDNVYIFFSTDLEMT